MLISYEGNIAVGNVQHFLPMLTSQLQNPDKKLLALHALKEVVSHCSRGHLELVAGSLWKPLFDISDTDEETTRNVAAACLGQLTTSNPSQYLPELQVRTHAATCIDRVHELLYSSGPVIGLFGFRAVYRCGCFPIHLCRQQLFL